MDKKFPNIYKITGTVYSDMTCEEALKIINANVLSSKRIKKLDIYFAIIANYIRQYEPINTFTTNITNKYLTITWNDALVEILNRLSPCYSNLKCDVAISIIVDTCRKIEERNS